ncbi:MAG: IPT/TIG domain-containing protein [Myxococcales bacterium]|nr:MAG: IPT/TIG domain-containing protein [Myxococcales bacterium]
MRLLSGMMCGLLLMACGGAAEATVKGIDPSSGPTDGDQPVRIMGSNFSSDTGYTVYFGKEKSDSVTLINDKTIVAVSPRINQEGAVDVTIYSDDGAAFRIKDGYRYIIPSKGTTSNTESKKLRY